MAITTLAQLVSATPRRGIIHKSSAKPSVVALGLVSYWTATTTPGAGGVGAAATDFTAFTRSSTGAMAYTNPVSGNVYLSGIRAASSVAGMALLVDFIAQTGAITPAAGAYSWTGAYTTLRPASGDEVELWARVTTDLTGGVAHALTINYVDSNNNAKTGTINISANAPLGRTYQMVRDDSASPGIKQVTAVSGSGVPSGGAFCLVLLRRLAEILIPTADVPAQIHWDQTGLPRIYDDPCITFSFDVASGTLGPNVQLYPEFVDG